jgi:hypothetical protein
MKRALATLTAAALLGAVTLAGIGPAAADSVPYNDPAEVGYIAFCDAHGHSVDGGSLDALPFVAKAISSQQAEAPYNGSGATASLFAYQPREGVTPAEWSGEEISAPSLYSTPAHPTVVTTKGDITMGQFVGDYPPSWDGFVQLRLRVSSASAGSDPYHYAATDIKVDGDSWQVVRGGDIPCSAGKARSLATILAPQAAAGKLNSSDHPAPGNGRSTSSAASVTGSTTPAPTSGTGPLASSSAVADTASGQSSDGSFPVGYAVLGAVVALLAAALLITQRQRLRSLFARRGGSA